jgi:hypothetical protein
MGKALEKVADTLKGLCDSLGEYPGEMVGEDHRETRADGRHPPSTVPLNVPSHAAR